MSEFLSISIVGLCVSLLVEAIQTKWGTSSVATKWLTVLIAIVAGSLYYFGSQSSIWESVLGVLAAASTVYAFIFKK